MIEPEQKEEEIDDFDFLGDEQNVMRYLNREDPDNCVMLGDCEVPQTSKKEGDTSGVRRNPERKAKEGISYCVENDDDDVDDYCKSQNQRLSLPQFSNSVFPLVLTRSHPLRLLEV